MELSSEEGEIPIPINSTTSYGGGNNGHGHLIHHHHNHEPAIHSHMIPNSSVLPVASAPPHNGGSAGGGGGGAGGGGMEEDQHGPYSKKLVVKYRECLKNHAASMGGNATDGCGEFMPSGEEGTLEALTCSACHCHRNFHRKEIEGHDEQHQHDYHHHHHHQYLHHPYRLGGRKLLLPPPAAETMAYPTPPGNILPSRMIMPYNIMGSHYSSLPSDLSDDQEDHPHPDPHHGMMRPHHHHQNKKRFRTRFTQEQKEKMLSFAERVGWKIQKQEESVVQQFCQEIGVKRRVLKVWMHNNKHNLAKKINPTTPTPIPTPTDPPTTTTTSPP